MKTSFTVAGLCWLTTMAVAQTVEGNLENITAKRATIVLKVSTIGKGYDYKSIYANVGYYDINHKSLERQSVFLDNLTPDLDIYRKEITLNLLKPSMKFVKFVNISRTALGGKADSFDLEQKVEGDFHPVIDGRPDVGSATNMESYKETKRKAARKMESEIATDRKITPPASSTQKNRK